MKILLNLLLFSLFFTSASRPGVANPQGWPDWVATTANGAPFQSRQLEGKVVVISIWGSWCPSCRKQIPILDSLQSSLGENGVQFLAFSLDRSSDEHEQYIRDNKVQIPSIFARNGEGLKLVRQLQQSAGTLEAVPTVLIYDRKGRMAHRLVGFFHRKDLEAVLAPLMKE